MQIRIFTVPIIGGESEQEEMNRFLRGNRVVSVDKHFCQREGVECWTFCITVAESYRQESLGEHKEKVDYKEVLDAKTFAVFTELRLIRKQLANEDAVPAYAVFTDVELAEIAKQESIDETSIMNIRGIGSKRMEKYGQEMCRRYREMKEGRM